MKTKSKYTLLGVVSLIAISSLIFWNHNRVNENKSLNIVFFDEKVKKYVNEASDPSKDKDAAWNQYIQKDFDALIKKNVPSIDQEMASSCLFKSYFNSPSALKLYLDSSKNADITQAIKTSYEKSKRISGATEKVKVSVVILPISGTTYGLTGGGNFIVLYVNCLDSKDKLLKDVEGIFAHEYAHTLSLDYAEKHGGTLKTYPNTFLAQTILEGKACVFANISTEGNADSILIPKTPINEFAYYQDILNKEFTETDYFTYVVGDKSFTRSDCYYYGIAMVEKYLETHTEIQPQDWLYLTPEEMFNAVQ